MAPGRQTTDATWRSLVRQERGGEQVHSVEWNWDCQKAFDNVDRQVLWNKAEAQGHPMDLLAT